MPQKISPFASLKFKNFSLYWWGFLFSEIGSQMQVVAINWQIYELTRSPIALGLVGFVSFLPIFLLSLFAGLITDKVDRKRLLIISQIFQAVSAFILAVSTFMDIVNPILMYSLIFFSWSAKTFQAPARQALIPHLVPKEYFINAVSLNSMIMKSASVVGPAVGGFIIEYLGVKGVYFFNALSFIILIFALIPIKTAPYILEKNLTYSFKSMWEGVKFVRSNRVLYSTMLLDFFANFFSSATTLLPIFAKDILQVGPRGLGILYAAPSIGSLIAGLIISSMNITNQGKVIIGAVLLYAFSTIGFGLSKDLYLSIIFLSLVGVGDMVSTILRNTIRQLLTPDYLRGRMTSVNMIFIQGGPLIGEAEAGLLASVTGAPISVALGGGATVIATLLIAKSFPKLKNYTSQDLRF